MNKETLERIAYHEAGHVVVAYALGYADELSVVIHRNPINNNYGVTSYRRIEYPSDIYRHRMNLIQIAFAGCAGETLYCNHRNIKNDKSYFYHSDDKFILNLLNDIPFSNSHRKRLLEEMADRSLDILKKNENIVREIAQLLITKPDVTFYYQDLQKILTGTYLRLVGVTFT